jgi:hypothetical protein
VRVNYFYKELEKKIAQPSPEYDHVQAIYILYLLTFNKYPRLTQDPRVPPPAPVHPLRQTLRSPLRVLHRPRTRHKYRQLHAGSGQQQEPTLALLLGLLGPHFGDHPTRVAFGITPRIVRSLECSTSSIPIKEALRILRFNSLDELKGLISANRESALSRNSEWKLEGDKLVIQKNKKQDIQINSDQVIKKLLDYAHDIETNI